MQKLPQRQQESHIWITTGRRVLWTRPRLTTQRDSGVILRKNEDVRGYAEW
jgi:hypothetical protein